MKSTSVDQTPFDGETIDYELYPLVTGEHRLALLQEACGMFEGRENEMLAQLAKIRGGFDREPPSITY